LTGPDFCHLLDAGQCERDRNEPGFRPLAQLLIEGGAESWVAAPGTGALGRDRDGLESMAP
jgi:hypothetical protein